MYSKRGLDILRASINKDRIIFKKRESCKSTFSKTAIFDNRNQRPCACLYPSVAVSTRSISRFVQNWSIHTTKDDVSIGESADPAAEEKQNSNENILTCELPVDFDLISSSLQTCSSVEEQLEKLHVILRLTPEDIKSREAICKSVEDMLLPFFKKCHVQMYGSSANGFGFKGCDIDMSFNVPDFKKKAILAPSYGDIDIPSIEDVASGKVSTKELIELPSKEQLLFVHSVLLEKCTESTNPVIFINAYVPIIRFHTEKPKLQCDLSYGNRVAYSNTKLLNIYGNLDRRANLLVIAIRYWAKRVGLVGKGLLFNSYTMSLLVIFFLQTRNPPILPTTEYVMSISDALRNEDMSDFSYLKDISKITPSENKQTTEELLKEFFLFYTYFDYTQVICPLTGTSVPRNDFFALNPKFRMNSVCIQDPLKLTHNVATLVDYKICKLLFTEMLMALKICHDDTLWCPNSLKWGFLSILDRPADFSTSLLAGDNQLSFEISKSLETFENLDKENEIGLTSQTNENQMWLHRASQAVLDILEYALLFKCTIVNNPNSWTYSRFGNEIEEAIRIDPLNQIITSERYNYLNLKNSKVRSLQNSQLKDFSLDVQNVVFTAHCIAFENTWLGRENVKMDNISVDPLDVEHAISSKLLHQETDEKKKMLFRFICECSAPEVGSKTSMLVRFKPYLRHDFNPILGLFLKNYVPKVINRVLQTANNELPKRQNLSNS